MADPKRKLAAILAADAAGYSRLMSEDEDATLVALDACREVFRSNVLQNGGRVVDTAGDSVLAVFETATGAVKAAHRIQEELTERNDELPDQRHMAFRIGINLGEVIEKDDGTVYGDGVNVAARLEGLAEPSGICLSGSAHEQVEGKIDLSFHDIGEHEVKNIARPVRAYRADIGSSAASSSEKPLALPDKPSIAVLPFDNLSGDPEQEYFADGIAEDLITALSRIRWLFVTARNSTFTYKGKAVDLKQVGRDMGVRYVVEGSVRRGGNRVRISAQLIDATTGNHVWADRFDRDLEDIFALQDEITETIVAAIEPELGVAERERAMRKPPSSLEAWDYYQRGMWHLYRFTANDNAEAQRHFRRAIDLDSRFGSAYSSLAYSSFLDVAMDYTDSPDDRRADAQEAAKAALALDAMDAMAHCALGRLYGWMGVAHYDAAIIELKIAIDINPSFALAHFGLAHALTHAGHLDEALAELDDTLRLSPHDPYLWLFETLRGNALIMMNEYEQALPWIERATRHGNAGFWAYEKLASCLGHLGRRREAKGALQQLLVMKPDYSLSIDTSYTNPELQQNLADGLRKAGLDNPDEPTAAD
jgi:adenylate cyclase